MAVHAIGSGCVACRYSLAMHAGLILRKLVDPLLRFKLMDQSRIAVTASAQFGDGSSSD
jgi:hypothetical protein